MDWQGQKLAEQIMQYALLIAAVGAFLAGYVMGSFKLMLLIYAACVLAILLAVVPDWPCYNRHPLEWVDPKTVDLSAKNSKAKPQTTSKRPTKPLKK